MVYTGGEHSEKEKKILKNSANFGTQLICSVQLGKMVFPPLYFSATIVKDLVLIDKANLLVCFVLGRALINHSRKYMFISAFKVVVTL